MKETGAFVFEEKPKKSMLRNYASQSAFKAFKRSHNNLPNGSGGFNFSGS
jgi:hypothetical protein